VGDLNLHLDVKDDLGVMKFESLLVANNYVQHVSVATHVGGHLLDVVLTQGDLPALSTNVSQPGGLSHHHSMIVCQLNISAQDHHATVVQYRRNWRSFDLDAFRADIASSQLVQSSTLDNVDELFTVAAH